MNCFILKPEIIKECDRHRNEDLFSRSKGFQAFSMRNKAFSHTHVLLFVYFYFSLVISFSSTSISFRISPLSTLLLPTKLLISGLYKAVCLLWFTTKCMYYYFLVIRAGRSGALMPVGPKFSAPVQTHPASCTMGTGSFPGGKERPGRDADPSPSSNAVDMKG